LLAGVALVSVAAQGGTISSEAVATFTESKSHYLGDFSHLEFPIFAAGHSDSIGGVVGGVGAQASGSVSTALKGFGEAFWFPYYSFAYSSKNRIDVKWDGDLSVGESFFVSAGATPLKWGKVHLQDPGFEGSVGLREQFSASANASGCLGGCLEIDLWLKLVQQQTLASIVGGKGNANLLVLGQNVANVLPYTYTDPGNVLKLTVGAPDFSATIANAGTAAAVSHTSEQLLAAASVNVAQLVASLVGLPVPLSGSLAGFGYTLLEALVGLGVDLERWFQLAASKLYTSLLFSAPVQVFDNGAWGSPTTSFTPVPGTFYEVRPVQAATTLGIEPVYGLTTDLDATLDLVPFASTSVRALEIYGHGVSFGPLLNKTVKGSLAHVELGSTDVERSYFVPGKPITLQFDPLVVNPGGIIVDLCPDADDCLATGFFTRSAAIDDQWSSDRIVLANDFAGDCLLGILDPRTGCGIDDTFAPLRVDYRPGPSRTDPLELTPRFDELLGILGAPDLVSGPESGIAQLEDALRRLGIDLDANGLPRSAPPGNPPPTEPILGHTRYEVRIEAVPEPRTETLLALGLLALGVARLRRRPLRPTVEGTAAVAGEVVDVAAKQRRSRKRGSVGRKRILA
jgi:hypothetical protein